MALQKRKLQLSFWRRVVEDIASIIRVYKKMNTIMSFGLDSRVRREGIHQLGDCRLRVDIGVGPGDSIVLLVDKCQYVIGVEPSDRLARASLENCRVLGAGGLCDIVVAVAEKMPFRGQSIDCAASFFAVRDFFDLNEGLNEIGRVVKSNFVVGDIFLPKSRIVRFALKIWVCLFVPIIAFVIAGRVWRSYLSLCRTLSSWITIDELASALLQKGWYKVYSRAYGLGGLGVVYGVKGSS